MSHEGFLKKHRIKRQSIRKDIIFFGVPALLVFSVGLIVCSIAGFDGFTLTMWKLIQQPQMLSTFSTAKILGFGVIALGFVFMFVSLFTLRRSYSSTLVIRENHRLVTHGIYRFVRHPIYLGVLLVAFGVPLSVTSLGGFLIMAVLFPIFLVRIRLEEKLLLSEFGEAYNTYKANTRKLIPFLF